MMWRNLTRATMATLAVTLIHVSSLERSRDGFADRSIQSAVAIACFYFVFNKEAR